MATPIIDPSSDPSLTLYGNVPTGTYIVGNTTINVTNIEEITQQQIFNTSYNNTAGGTNSTVQFNVNNQLVGDAGLTYDPNSDTLTVAGSVVTGFVVGSGAQLSNIQAANIVGAVPTASFASVSGTVSNSLQPNITTVGTLLGLNVLGNAAVSALQTNQIQYANGEPWVFDVGTGNLRFQGSLIYSDSNSTITISPSYQENVYSSITIPSDTDASGNVLSIVNEINGVTITTGDGTNLYNFNLSNVGTFTIPGDIVVSNVPLNISTDTANSITIETNNGNANSVSINLNDDNNVEIYTDAGNYIWVFDNTGNVTLPSGNPTIIGGGNAGVDSQGTLSLIPDSAAVANDQFVIVDPVSNNAVHLRAGGTADASNSDLILGGANTFVKTSDTTGNVTVSTKDGLGNMFAFVFSDTGVEIPGQVSATGNIFGALLSVSGNLTGANIGSPGNMSIAGNITANNVSLVGNITADYFNGDGSNLTNLPSQLGNFQISSNILSVFNNTNNINIQTASANAVTPNGQDINLSAANGFDTGIGGEINITAGNGGANGTGQGGAVSITAGNGTVDSLAGSITLTAGQNDGTGDAGSITLYAGVAEDGDGGDIIISGAGSNNGVGGDVTISAGVSNTAANGVITLTTDSTESYVFSGTVLELPNSDSPAIQVANEYPVLVAYGSNSHGGPELSWMDTDDPANMSGDVTVVRNTMYFNDTEFYVGFNENNNTSPTFTGAFTIDASDGLTTAPANLSVVGSVFTGTIAVGSDSNISGANVISANTFQGNITALGNVEGNIVVGNYLYGDGSNINNVTSTGFANGNSNIGIINNANINFSSAGVANVVVITDAGANVNGYVDANYFVGDGANLTGIDNLENGNSNVVITANGNITLTATSNATMVVTDTGANVTGYVDATYFVGDGANLTNIVLSGIENGNSNVSIIANAEITFSAAGNANVVVITDLGANVDGYVDATYFVGDGANITGITLANLDNGNSNIVITANANITFTSSANAIMTITDTGANVTGYANITGNVTVGNLIGPVASGNSNIAITANGNITLTATSNSTMIITDTGANVTGYANITANANVGNLGTGGLISATGNITGATVAATVAHKLPVYADTTARDAGVTSPTAGMMIWLTSGANVQVYTGSVWANLQPT